MSDSVRWMTGNYWQWDVQDMTSKDRLIMDGLLKIMEEPCAQKRAARARALGGRTLEFARNWRLVT